MTTTSTTARTWVTGTVLLAVVILLGTWFLGASPQLARAAETRAATEQALATQDALRLRLAELREQSENLDVYRAQLAAVREHVPVTADLAGYVDRLDALAAEHGVALTGVLPGTPAAVVAPVPAQPAPAADASSTGATAGNTAAAAAAPPPGAGLVTVPLSVTAAGAYDAVMAFVSDLQGDGRLYVVTGLSATSRTPGEVTPGHAPAAPGDVAVTIDGGLLVLPDDVVPAAAEQAEGAAGTDDAGPAGLPTTARNPFGAVAGG